MPMYQGLDASINKIVTICFPSYTPCDGFSLCILYVFAILANGGF